MSSQNEFELGILRKALQLHDTYGVSAGAIILASRDWLQWERLEKEAGGVPLLRQNLDYGEGWFGSIEEIKKRRLGKLRSRVGKRRKSKKKRSTAAYCAKEDVKEYWSEAGEDEAVKEFLKYLDEVECP